ncbi:MAG: hypothetical protein FJY17_08995 [Bacteroidetes bacterium]|nr:hypothetical protein [Bacteroidota bacterium]
MSTTDFFWNLGDLFQATFLIFEVVGNYFNYLLILLGFFGFIYWMNIQRKLSAKSNVPSEVSHPDFKSWYSKEDQKLK